MQFTSLFPRHRPPAPTDDQDGSALVRLLNQQYLAAARANDAGWFLDHLSDDVVIILGDGRRMQKADFLTMLRQSPRPYRSLELRNATLRVFGPTVQVDADASWELENGTSGVSRYIDTWVRLDGRWRVISAQMTPLPQ